MDHQPSFRSSSRLVEAEWLQLPMFTGEVSAIVPEGFPAYARILHPAGGMYDVPVRWSDVAAKTGRTMHRLVQFHAINPPDAFGSISLPNPPDTGNLPADQLRVLSAALSQHTNTPDTCWFCLWEGHGWLHDSGTGKVVFTKIDANDVEFNSPDTPPLSEVLRAAVLNAPRVHLPDRAYLLFEGPLQAAAEFGWFLTSEYFVPQSPNLFWPDDHAWCVASEIDLFCTLVAGSDELIESLIADPRLEAWRVFADDPITADSDHVNL